MGQLLASEEFMRALPVPRSAAWIYAGTAGPRAPWYPLGDEANDYILKVSETQLPGIASVAVPAGHTFLMNARALVPDLVGKARSLA